MANVNRYDDLETGTIAYATFLSCVVLLITILAVRALCYAWVEGEAERKTANAHYVTADEKISEQKSRLAGYRKQQVEVTATPEGDAAPQEVETKMVDRISIPIDRAKELVLGEASK